jgi:ribosomal protein L7/L12
LKNPNARCIDDLSTGFQRTFNQPIFAEEKMETLRCPSCGSTEINQVGYPEYQCAYCGTRFVTQNAPSGFVDVILTQGVGNKDLIKLIQAIRIATDLDLYNAKKAAENPPIVIKQSVSQAEGERIKSMLEKTGAKVQLKPA